jgi:hypothetical protein
MNLRKLIYGVPFCTLLFVMVIFNVAASAQGLPSVPARDTANMQRPNPTGKNPIHQEAKRGIFSAFDHYEVVGINAAHGNQDLDMFILDLFRDPVFPGKINDVEVECGNSLYQPALDRYIAGEDSGLAEVRQVWRNTTQPMCGTSAFYEELFPLIRRLNQRLPPERRVRVLAGDPPIDWSTIKTREDMLRAPWDRDSSIASVMEKEVLSKHRKALMLFGTAHLFHGTMAMGILSAVGRYEKNYPGVTLVVADHEGFGNGTQFAMYSNELESRMSSWPVPSLVLQMKGTWLGNLLDTTYSSGVTLNIKRVGKDGKTESYSGPLENGNKFSKMVDAYLYLGPRDFLLREPATANVFLDKDYMTEMKRRVLIMGEGSVTDQADPEKVAKQPFDPFLYGSDRIQ